MNQDQFRLTSNKSSREFSIILLCLGITFFTMGYFNDAQFIMYFGCIGIFTGLLCVIDFLDKRPILLIDENGIWVKSKNKKISWNRISSFSTIEIYDYEGAHIRKINFHLKTETIKVVYVFADQTIDAVRAAILNYSSEYTIIDKGHHKEGFKD